MILYAEAGLVKWKIKSDDFPYKWLLNGSKIPFNTVMGEYFNKDNTEDVYKTEQVWAMVWFSYLEDCDRAEPSMSTAFL